jgi:hypothetical protein
MVVNGAGKVKPHTQLVRLRQEQQQTMTHGYLPDLREPAGEASKGPV